MKTNKLDIKKLEIYLKHPNAEWFIRKERKRQNTYLASLATFLLGCLCLLAMFMVPTLRNPRWLPIVVIAITLISLFVASAHSEREPDPVIQDIWILARELCVPAETLWRNDVRAIEEVGMKLMASLAVDILDFEAQVEKFEIKEASTSLNNLILDRLDDHKAELKSRLSNIHRALRAFKLGPEKYDEAFKEAKKRHF